MAIGSFRLPISPTATATGDHLVRFIDIDGTILKSEMVVSGQSATAPDSPTRQYLTFSAWNNTFTNVTRSIDVGAIYNTTNGKSYLFITLTPTTGLSPTMYLGKINGALMTVDWGDSTISTSTAGGFLTFAHTYSAEGNYIITITCGGGYYLGQSSSTTAVFKDGSYRTILTAFYKGVNFGSISDYTFYNHLSLKMVSLSSTAAAFGSRVFSGCSSLKSISITSGVTNLNDYLFQNCFNLRTVSMPVSITTITQYTFMSCSSLASICLSPNITSTATALFSGCYYLTSIVFPIGMTTIGATGLNLCYGLRSVIIPEGVTTIGISTFASCVSLTSIIIPSSITALDANTFNSCYSLIDYQILATAPPTITTTTFASLNGTTKIYVPDASVATYKAATNWTVYANYIYPISTRPN